MYILRFCLKYNDGKISKEHKHYFYRQYSCLRSRKRRENKFLKKDPLAKINRQIKWGFSMFVVFFNFVVVVVVDVGFWGFFCLFWVGGVLSFCFSLSFLR